MLNKILLNLRFKPHYFQRLHNYRLRESKEKRIRGLGFALVFLALLIQLFAFISPPHTQANASPNDLIPGGVTSRADVIYDCVADYHYVQIIYEWYGVSCNDIANSSVVSLVSTSYGGQLYSLGHLPYNLPGETPVNILGGTLYWRLLHGWDTGPYSTYTALQVTADSGKTFFILFNCGNLVSIGLPAHYVPTPPATTSGGSSPPATQPAPVPAPLPTPTPTPRPCPFITTSSTAACKPCAASQGIDDVIDCLVYSKTASNLTQSIPSANNTTANPGDIIQYNLTVTNTGQAAVPDFTIQESLSDVLEYANTDNLNGGTIDSSGELTWPAVTVNPGATVQRSFTVQVKNPVPDTAPGTDDPEAYNFVMTNIYGNTININIVKPILVTTAVTPTTSLPNTGPGSGVFVAAAATLVVGYFYARSRLLVKESKIAEEVYISENHA